MQRFTTPEEARAAPLLPTRLRDAILAAVHTELALAGSGYDPDAHGGIWLLEEGDRDAEVAAAFGTALTDLPFERVRHNPGTCFLCHLVRNNSRCDTLIVLGVPLAFQHAPARTGGKTACFCGTTNRNTPYPEQLNHSISAGYEYGTPRALATGNPRGRDVPMKIAMIVDDEPMLRLQAKAILESYGFDQIVEADNGADAVTLALKLEPLLIVMDIGMPQLDGISAADRILKKFPTPIVLMTAAADPDTIERARLAGVMNYVIKPFRDEQLYAAVDLAIHQFVEIYALREEVTKLKETIETRKLVDKAKLALMQRGLSEPEAYRKLQKLAMDKRKSLKEVAEAVLLME